ncbi:hypothetical protein FB45DRAFT_944426, partial [Roridomyces roridus]
MAQSTPSRLRAIFFRVLITAFFLLFFLAPHIFAAFPQTAVLVPAFMWMGEKLLHGFAVLSLVIVVAYVCVGINGAYKSLPPLSRWHPPPPRSRLALHPSSLTSRFLGPRVPPLLQHPPPSPSAPSSRTHCAVPLACSSTLTSLSTTSSPTTSSPSRRPHSRTPQTRSCSSSAASRSCSSCSSLLGSSPGCSYARTRRRLRTGQSCLPLPRRPRLRLCRPRFPSCRSRFRRRRRSLWRRSRP